MNNKWPPETIFHLQRPMRLSRAGDRNFKRPVTLPAGWYRLSVESMRAREYVRIDGETFEPVERIPFELTGGEREE